MLKRLYNTALLQYVHGRHRQTACPVCAGNWSVPSATGAPPAWTVVLLLKFDAHHLWDRRERTHGMPPRSRPDLAVRVCGAQPGCRHARHWLPVRHETATHQFQTPRRFPHRMTWSCGNTRASNHRSDVTFSTNHNMRRVMPSRSIAASSLSGGGGVWLPGWR